MSRLDPTLLKRRLCLKAVRSIIGLKFSTARDTELDRVLAEVEAAWDEAVLRRQTFELDIAGLLEEPAVVRNAAAPVRARRKKSSPANTTQRVKAPAKAGRTPR